MNRLLRCLAVPALLAASAPISSAQVANVVQDDFTGTSATNPWIALRGACLTAGDATTTVSNGIGIPACIGDPYYNASRLPFVGLPNNGTSPDPAGSGALRLTNGGSQGGNESGAIVSATPFPASQGVQVTFTTYTYGGNALASGGGKPGADGIGFYLIDASQFNQRAFQSTDLGAFGGSLGYSCSNRNYPFDGMLGGYIGLGIDEYGNYLNYTDNTATGQTTNANAGTQNPGEFGLRGAGNVNWTWLNSHYPQYYPTWLTTTVAESAVQATCRSGTLWDYSGSSPRNTRQSVADYAVIPGSVVTLPSTQSISSQEKANSTNVLANRKPGYATPITYKVTVTPDGLLSFAYDYNNAHDAAGNLLFQPVMDQVPIASSNGTPPASYLFGFGGSTGGGTNVHEITCFEASPAARMVGAPVAPAVISSGQFLYTLSSNPSPVQGFVSAYTLNSSGLPASTASWEAGSLMKATRSALVLKSTAANGQSVVGLNALDSAAFQLPARPSCLPSGVATVIGYTVDPNSVTAPGSCGSYLGTRAVGSVLSGFSPGDSAALLQPPGTSADIGQPGYIAFATSQSGRPRQLLFTNDDGFVYSVDASSGALRWGWMPRSFVAQLQNYGSWPYSAKYTGNFSIIDASTPSGNASTRTWATYVVGGAQYIDYASGSTPAPQVAMWYDVRLDAQGAPSGVVTTLQAQTGNGNPPPNTQWLPAGVSSLGLQAPVSATVAGDQYVAFLVRDAAGKSYLVEMNVATGAARKGNLYYALPGSVGTVTSNLYLDSATGQLYFGNSRGTIFVTSFTGDAKTDATSAMPLNTVIDAGDPVQYVGAQNISGSPYVWAATAPGTSSYGAGITLFGIGNNGWSALWASTSRGAYTDGASGWVASPNILPLQSGGVISDAPRVVNGLLLVPVYVTAAASAGSCSVSGSGYYDFFQLPNGIFPQNAIKIQGKPFDETQPIGQGSPYTPNLSVNGSQVDLFGASQQSAGASAPLTLPIASLNGVLQWRVH